METNIPLSTASRFKAELFAFSKANWWVYALYACLIGAVLRWNNDDTARVVLVTTVHFVADIFIIMMLNAYAERRFALGAYYQVVSMLLFTSLKVYSGLLHGGWHYLAADPVYMLAAIKNYRLEVGGKDIRAVNTWSMLLLSMGIILFFLVPGDVVSGDDPERGPSRWVLTLGIFTFAVALATVGKEKLRYQLSVWGLVLMVIGGAWDTYNSFVLPGQITYGLEISYFLLPLTVLAFFLGKWSKFMAGST